MIKQGYLVRFHGFTVSDAHRVQNFAEAVFLEMRDQGLGGVPNMDSAIEVVEVEVASKRALSGALKAIKRQLARHRLNGNAEVSR